MTITTARAQLFIAQAQHRAAVLETPTAIALVNPAAELIGCIRVDGATADLMDRAVKSAQSAAAALLDEDSPDAKMTTSGIGLVPCWQSDPSAPAIYEGVLAVAADNPRIADDIASGAVADVLAFDERHRRQIS